LTCAGIWCVCCRVRWCAGGQPQCCCRKQSLPPCCSW
jgi:hypothetical protein